MAVQTVYSSWSPLLTSQMAKVLHTWHMYVHKGMQLPVMMSFGQPHSLGRLYQLNVASGANVIGAVMMAGGSG